MAPDVEYMEDAETRHEDEEILEEVVEPVHPETDAHDTKRTSRRIKINHVLEQVRFENINTSFKVENFS